MKLDMHVHTVHSGYTTIWPWHRVLRESYNTPEGVDQLARRRGMDLVTLTRQRIFTSLNHVGSSVARPLARFASSRAVPEMAA